ncbi:DUF1266 domain-containing protein [Aidingimonas lacisalsi]|uniref:DUF1266 domain-containing protein n=1 Tax=Aidingimonas lacisalsi TaxID=2604086 RepID=UPI00191C2C45|nr:YbeU/YbeR family protein [Aidingimonas lacisalsi]
MVDPLKVWWAQQLVLCGWPFEPDPTAMDPELAEERLRLMDVQDRGELGWRLLDACTPETSTPAAQLSALEWLALATASRWMDEARALAWVHHLADDITRRHQGLDEWLRAVRRARGAEGWVLGDDEFPQACEALATLEREGEGITWDRLVGALQASEPTSSLWADPPVWRLRAMFAPTLMTPARAAWDAPNAAEWLRREWGVTGRDDLVRTLLWLAGQGDRYQWDMDATRLLDMETSARYRWLASLQDGVPYGRTLVDFVSRGEPLEWAAWDWLRLVELAFIGDGLAWLDADEARAFAAHAADLMSHRYNDWIALTNAYQRGRSLFEGRDLMADIKRDCASLWYSPVSPWQLPLAELLDEQTRDMARATLREWRNGAMHWVLTLASVREPGLLSRQARVMTSPSDDQREQARQHLRETLGVYPGDGAASLSRFWLPAQAHHLNQLAADASHGALPPTETRLGKPDPGAVQQRTRLQGCSRHAATIHMAEKFAFYLQLAMDSGDFDPRELEAMADALRSVLCRFYGDPRRLLDAWAAWETALPEDSAMSLVQDIHWHRDDPGSPFHWLDWQISAWDEPGQRPSLRRFTALSLVGPLNPNVWGEPMEESARECQAIREWLDGHYALHDGDALREFLDFLLHAGDRQEYQINYAPYTLNQARLASEIAMLESSECDEDDRNHLLRLQRVRDNDARCNEVDMAAWDAAQAVDLAMAGRQLGWLSADDFNAYLDASAALAEAHYGEWSAYAAGLYAGFAFFMAETDERDTFLLRFREALVAWLTGAPPLAGPWASLDFPGARPHHWAPMHIDTLLGDAHTLH